MIEVYLTFLFPQCFVLSTQVWGGREPVYLNILLCIQREGGRNILFFNGPIPYPAADKPCA